MLKTALVAILIAVTNPASTPVIGPGKATKIIDGDTIDLTVREKTYRIRFWGWDAPERYTVTGRAATSFLAALVYNKEMICLDTRQRSFERIVARCFVYQRSTKMWADVGTLMVVAGHATDMPGYSGGLYAK